MCCCVLLAVLVPWCVNMCCPGVCVYVIRRCHVRSYKVLTIASESVATRQRFGGAPLQVPLVRTRAHTTSVFCHCCIIVIRFVFCLLSDCHYCLLLLLCLLFLLRCSVYILLISGRNLSKGGNCVVGHIFMCTPLLADVSALCSVAVLVLPWQSLVLRLGVNL